MRRIALAVFAAVLPLAGACADDHHGGEDDPVNCAKETADEFVVGLQKTGTVLDVRLMSATPAPPNRGDNEWIIQVKTVSGAAPVTGATIEVTPFMPTHQHGTPVKATVESMPSAGEYKLKSVNLWMPGVWETTIEMMSSSGTDQVVYRFCIPS
ncbi:MAG: FixH family protein [Deltaproteobacteria bacterium]|nr:FixH family protein [Deltaproteobacteria bacterium]